tara:strand:+ start:332 stop:439 length:108 start_codon:yes stop_codon:yes gene_type:complete
MTPMKVNDNARVNKQRAEIAVFLLGMGNEVIVVFG